MYDHRKYAGNRFDMFKHRLLLKIAGMVKPNSYLETHCGYPEYYLPEKWESSWRKILREFPECDLTLCDNNLEVVKELLPIRGLIVHGDGFTKINPISLAGVDLCFIDPGYTDPKDWQRVRKALDFLTTSFSGVAVVWYPVLSRQDYRWEGLYDDDGPHLTNISAWWELQDGGRGCGVLIKGLTWKQEQKLIPCLEETTRVLGATWGCGALLPRPVKRKPVALNCKS